jgi:hypothetical protein
MELVDGLRQVGLGIAEEKAAADCKEVKFLLKASPK